MGPETFRPSDLETIWQAIEEFHAAFKPADWNHRHGPDWDFLDVPFHLMTYNQMLLDAIQRQNGSALPEVIHTLEEQDHWNARQFARRPISRDPVETLLQYKATQIEIQHLAEDMDRAIYLPALYARGWRTVQFALEFIFHHTWRHFTEAHFRRNNWLPGLQDRITHVALNFQMEINAVSINIEVAQRLGDVTWKHIITDNAGGEWTFMLRDGICTVQEGNTEQPDFIFEQTLIDYARGFLFDMGRPVPMMGGKARRSAALFRTPPDQPIPPLTRGRTSPVV